MANTALLVGINDYRSSPLRGCVNDVVDVAELLVSRFGFNQDEIRLVTDGRATKERILDGLRQLVRSLRPGDRAVFHFSGHGVRLPSDTEDEDDSLDEAVCPVDFTWDDLTSGIRDKDFRRVFVDIPEGASFVWISDSCHSGDLTRQLTQDGETRPRYFQPPPDLAWQLTATRRRRARAPRTLHAIAEAMRLAFLSGCGPEQTSADAMFQGRSNGAFSYFLLKELSGESGLKRPLSGVSERVGQALSDAGFTQRPTLEAAAPLPHQPFLALVAGPSGLTSGTPLPAWVDLFTEIDRRVAADRAFEQAILAQSTIFTRELARSLNLDTSTPLTVAPTGVPRGGTVVRTFWWGFHVQIARRDLLDFLNVAAPINAIVAAIGPVTGPAAPFVAVVAGFIAGSLALLRGLDRGRGVYVSMSWFAPGVFVPTSV